MKNQFFKIKGNKNRKQAIEVFNALVSRAPSELRYEFFILRLPHMSASEIDIALKNLEDTGFIERSESESDRIPERKSIVYKLKNPNNYPIIDYLPIGDINFPLVLDGDTVRADDINMLVEAIAEYNKNLESHVNALSTKMLRKYWGNIITLFGVFVSIFALILKATDPIVGNQSLTYIEVFLYKFFELLPLAVILGAFIFLLRLIMNRF